MLHLPAMLTMQAGRCRRVCLGLKPIVQVDPPKAFGVVYSDIRIPGAMPQVRHGESVLWRTTMIERLWR